MDFITLCQCRLIPVLTGNSSLNSALITPTAVNPRAYGEQQHIDLHLRDMRG